MLKWSLPMQCSNEEGEAGLFHTLTHTHTHTCVHVFDFVLFFSCVLLHVCTSGF